MQKVTAPQVATTDGAATKELPQPVQEALGDLAGAAKEGLLALSVGVGLGVVHELMEAEVTEVCGPKGQNDPERSAVRHGHEDGKVTLGGRRVPVERPRMQRWIGATWPNTLRIAERGGLFARGTGGDRHRAAPRRLRAPPPHPCLYQPLRVDDRDRPQDAGQGEALEGRRHADALDRRRHARGRVPVQAHHRLPRPGQPRRCGGARGRSCFPTQPHP